MLRSFALGVCDAACAAAFHEVTMMLVQAIRRTPIVATANAGPIDSSAEPALQDCIAALRRVATYRLSPALDRRLLWLSENKDKLADTEHEELLALVEFAEERTAEKLQARAALKRIGERWPHLVPVLP
jgi:hypothetical protein